jgi:hypothetical protein
MSALPQPGQKRSAIFLCRQSALVKVCWTSALNAMRREDAQTPVGRRRINLEGGNRGTRQSGQDERLTMAI